MKVEELIKTARTIKECIIDISNNKSQSYQWYAAKGKGGCLFEIGGRNKDNLQLKLYIPYYDESGNPIPLNNGFVDYHYSIEDFGIFFPNLNCPKEIDVLKMANSKDFRKWKPKVETYEYCTQSIIQGTIKNLK